MTYERKIDTPHAEAVALSVALHPHETDGLRGTIDQAVVATRDLIDDGVSAAREAIRHVPGRAWRIGAMLTAAAASLAIGTYAAFGRRDASRRPRATASRRTERRGSGTRSRKAA